MKSGLEKTKVHSREGTVGMNQVFVMELPQPGAFYRLYGTTGWLKHMELGEEKLFEAAARSWRVVSVYKDGVLAGFGRIVSDGVMQAFLCDIIVAPEYQRRGIGTTIVRMLLAEANAAGIPSISLCCALGKADFYRRFGFTERAPDAPGMVWRGGPGQKQALAAALVERYDAPQSCEDACG